MSKPLNDGSWQKMPSEARNPNSTKLDTYSALEIVTLQNKEDKCVATAISAILPQIAALVEHIHNSFMHSGRLIYVGAGTSGRLGVLDASECPPTFGTDPEQIIAIIAGGDKALRMSLENAEDDEVAAINDIEHYNLTTMDVVIGIAASGYTPYVVSSLHYAKSCGCYTALITVNPQARLNALADSVLVADVGPEILTGSTRLKAGTAQKLILNMLTTASLILTGKVYQNLMIDIKAINVKLRTRAKHILVELTNCSYEEAESLLISTDYNVKLAILMQFSGLPQQKAKQLLKYYNGFLRPAIKDLKPS